MAMLSPKKKSQRRRKFRKCAICGEKIGVISLGLVCNACKDNIRKGTTVTKKRPSRRKITTKTRKKK
jgi:hypothetical protein